jgi:PhnB protein
MRISPYLNFNGNCREAMEFYAATLGGKMEIMMTHGESPMAAQVPPDWKDRIMHARIVAGDTVLMASDAPPEYYQPTQGVSISLVLNDAAQAERIFNTFAKDGSVTMPFQETFWAHRFGMVTDRYGIPWMINCELTQ